MAENNGSNAPDLQSILATLATFAQQPPNQGQTTASNHDRQDEEVLSRQHLQPQARAADPRTRPQSRSTASSKPNIDPASITTWQDGLRCVTKIAAQNAQFAVAIRKMMDNQRQNEMRWYSERQALKQGRASRERASAQASEILKGISNGEASIHPANSNAIDLDKELAAFDRKIYAAQLQMDAAMTSELKGLGVPFFGTSEDAVIAEDDERDLLRASSTRPRHSPLVTEKQLLELRRKMVEHLEALYRD